VPVHLGGLPLTTDAIWDLARRNRLFVIEDAAHAVGSFYRGAPIGAGNPATGARSDAVVFSFYATKNLTTGEGGMVTTHDERLEDEMRILCLHGISKDAWNRYSDSGSWHYDVVRSGFKYNLSDIQSGIGIHQLRKQERFIDIRTRYAGMYNQAFADVAEVELPPDAATCRHSWHLYALRLNLQQLDIDRAEFIRELRRKNICASVHFIPVPLLSFFAPYASLACNRCPNALALYPRLVSLPLYPAMTEQQIRYVSESVKDIVTMTRKTKSVSMATAAAEGSPA
jgi:dTDP-4-amino-4,6-dideoxygalactose transaminase